MSLLQNSHDVIPAKAGIHKINRLQIKRHGIIRFAHPSGRPVGVQCASALVRLKACRNDGVLQVALMSSIFVLFVTFVVKNLVAGIYEAMHFAKRVKHG
jgi:hypothetical protein